MVIKICFEDKTQPSPTPGHIGTTPPETIGVLPFNKVKDKPGTDISNL